jgi:cell division protein FtsQ
VQIEEQEPVAHWNDRGLVNERGEVFYPGSGSMPTLALRFEGPEEKAPQMLAFYDDLRRRLQRQGLRAVRLELDRRGEWRLKLANGVTLVVGRENPLYRLERLLGAYPVLRREGREIRRIDLRYEQGFAVAWREQKKG